MVAHFLYHITTLAILNKSEHKTRITAVNSRLTGEELVTSTE